MKFFEGFIPLEVHSGVLSEVSPEIPEEVSFGIPPGVITGISLGTPSGITPEFAFRISSEISSYNPKYLEIFSKNLFRDSSRNASWYSSKTSVAGSTAA